MARNDEFRVLPLNNPIDERTPVSYPSICKLSLTKPDGKVGDGTGFLINPTTVITAGHCVIGMSSIKVIFPASKIEIKAKRFIEFGKDKTPNDIGVILLSEPHKIQQYIALDHSSPLHANLEICGYQDKHNTCLGMSGPAELRDGFYYYEMDTTKGQSGGPALLQNTNTPTAIGVHVGYGGTDEKNRAAPFSIEFNQFVQEFRAS